MEPKLNATPSHSAATPEPEFVVNGLRYSRADMLSANDADDDFCAWIRAARAGAVWEQMHSERCECVAASTDTPA